MGVNIYVLDRRTVRLSTGGVINDVGTLHRFWKITEVDEERNRELEELEKAVAGMPSPAAAMVADFNEFPPGDAAGRNVRAHTVIGWDEGRTTVTDLEWDYLPVLGYAVRDPQTEVFVLHELRDGVLNEIGRERAAGLGLTDTEGRLLPHGQPVVEECRAVRPFIPGYAEADCSFSDGRQQKLLIGVTGDELPQRSWLVGKKPAELGRFPPAAPESAPQPG